MESIYPYYNKFDLNVLISCSNEERIKRIKVRGPKTKLDQRVKKDIGLAEKIEYEMRSILKKEPNFIEISTDKKPPYILAEEIMEKIK